MRRDTHFSILFTDETETSWTLLAAAPQHLSISKSSVSASENARNDILFVQSHIRSKYFDPVQSYCVSIVSFMQIPLLHYGSGAFHNLRARFCVYEKFVRRTAFAYLNTFFNRIQLVWIFQVPRLRLRTQKSIAVSFDEMRVWRVRNVRENLHIAVAVATSNSSVSSAKNQFRPNMPRTQHKSSSSTQ